MAAKELRDVWWQVLLLAPLVVLSVLALPPYESQERIRETFTAEVAVNQIFSLYTGGGVAALFILAILLGSLLISVETSRDTIFFLLSKPLSRNRILLTKYAVNAGVMLAAAILGHVFVLAFAVLVKGYPLGIFSAGGMALSSVQIWLVSLPVLGLATVFSVLFRNPLASFMATFAVIFAGVMVYVLTAIYMPLISYETWLALSDLGSRVWSLAGFASWELYNGESLQVSSFLFWATLSALVLLATLWLFRRKSY